MGEYSLSAVNSAANIDQHELEHTALRLRERPELKQAHAIASSLWRNAVAYPMAEQMSRFENMCEEYVFHFALRAANSDACYPKVMRLMTPPGQWFGRDIPGSRWGGDCPDFIYRVIPIAHGGQYAIDGHRTGKSSPHASYSLMGRGTGTPSTLAFLDSVDIVANADGEFTITINSSPASGRANHLQTQPNADHLLIRDTLDDWLTQTPNALRVQRLDKPERGPLQDAELAAFAVKGIHDAFFYAYYCTQSGNGQAPNIARAPSSSAHLGGMATQWGTKFNLCLGDDEALIVNANAAGANFRNVVLYDLFFMSTNCWSHMGSLNTTQMAPDEDGGFTYVVAHQDPGIHNWLDTAGMRRLIFSHRWQAFERGPSIETPYLSARVVKHAEVLTVLQSGVRRIDATGRGEQIARREAGFKQRFVDS